jgi:hypothetical protein
MLFEYLRSYLSEEYGDAATNGLERIGPRLKFCNLIYGKRWLTRVQYPYSRMRSKGSRFTLGVWGLRLCSLDVAIVAATVRYRPQPFA